MFHYCPDITKGSILAYTLEACVNLPAFMIYRSVSLEVTFAHGICYSISFLAIVIGMGSDTYSNHRNIASYVGS